MKLVNYIGIITVCVIFACTGLSACGSADKIEASITGYSDNCIEGVMYYQFRNGASVAYNTDGTIKTCVNK